MYMTGKYFIHQGNVKPLEQALISLNDINYAYGYGVYETLKLRSGLVFFPDQHVERLFHSADIIGIEIPFKKDTVENWIRELVSVNKLQDANIKMLCIGGPRGGDPNVYIFMLNPLFPDRKFYREGISVITFSGERHYPKAKSLSMLVSTMAYREAVAKDCYDALLVNRDSNITEGTRTNVFYVKNGSLFTPPADEALEGVTKHTLIDCLKKNRIGITEKDLPVSALDNVDGVFLTSTSSKVLPVSCANDIEIGIPDEVREIMKYYDEYLKEYTREFH